MIAFEQRASTVLFNLFQSHKVSGPFLLPANVCPVVPLVLCKARRDFEFVDIDPGTLCISHSAVMSRWASSQNRPAGLLYVRTYGAMAPTDDFFQAIRSMSPAALLIDDRCLCAPEFMAEPALSVDAVIYSTGYAKQVDIGMGGYGVLREGVPYHRHETVFNKHHLGSVMEECRAALSVGQPFDYIDSDWLDTAVPTSAWPAYREQVERERVEVSRLKTEINALYASRLPRSIQLADRFQSWRFNIQVSNKWEVLEAIKEEGLFASGHYQSLAHVLGSMDAPVAERLHRDVVNLFNDRHFSVSQADRVARVLAEMDLSPPEPRWQ